MTIKSTDYALLAQDSYNKPDPAKNIVLDGVTYRVFDHADNPKSGLQATAYRRVDTGEVVIAFRGTEFGREPVQDGLVDAGMALAGINAQAPDAHAFTQRVMAQSKAYAESNDRPLNVTVTGHSLGGTLAQLEAHKLGLKGETFNAFGAAGLIHGVPKGGHQVINHVRAGDAVSAASAHFGEVRVYAVQQDIDTLSKEGYRDNGGTLSVRNPARATDFSAHAIDNFVPNGKTLGYSIISRENQAQYHAHHGMIDRYRNDIYNARAITSVPLKTGVQAGQAVGHGIEAAGHAAKQTYDTASTAVVHAAETTGKAVVSGAKAAGHAAEQAYDAARNKVETRSRQAGEALERTGEAVREGASRILDKVGHPGSWFSSQTGPVPLLNDGQHSGNGFYKQALAGLEKINAERGIPSDQYTCNAAGTLASAACESRFKQIDLVAVNDNGSKLIAVQGEPGTAHSKVIGVDTVVALNTPLAQSSQAFAVAFADAHQQQQDQRSQQVNQPVQAQAASILSV
ncbi:XVIPCD domain-containing protein [Variovorax sp. ZT4R33]|uniref:XVIPCD domain-containing protein n=1 Tax=Variovorax sp. ZT4R33 TaxID=3443743 RepID=UPI003F46409F